MGYASLGSWHATGSPTAAEAVQGPTMVAFRRLAAVELRGPVHAEAN
jgi:hypothetical protein